MKNVENQNKQISTIMFVVIIIIASYLLYKLAGVPFWLMLALIFLFFIINLIATGEKRSPRSVGLACVFVFILIFSFVNSYWQANYPRSFKNSEILKARIDQTISRGMGDKVDVQAEDIWQKQRAVAAKRFLRRYDELLTDERASEAKDLEKKFHEIWGPNKEENEATVPTAPESSESIIRDSIFTTGTYYINVKGETPFNIIVMPTKTGCARYSLSSDKYNYKILFSDGEVVSDSPNTQLGYREIPKFKLFSREGEIVKLVIS